MHPTRWGAGVGRDLDELIDGLLRGGPAAREGWMQPSLDVLRRDGEMLVRVDLPGVDPERDLEITFEGGIVTIEGERHTEREERRDDWYLSERATGRFRRRLALPDSVDPDRIEAAYDAGVLTLRIPLREERRRHRRIEVSDQPESTERIAVDREGERLPEGTEGPPVE